MIFNSLVIVRLVSRLRVGRETSPAHLADTAPDQLPGLAPHGMPDLVPHGELRLSDIGLRDVVELVSIDLPADELEPLLELGVMPGCTLCPVRNSPFGDPVLMVDGSLIAVRREMARCLCVRRGGLEAN